MNRLGRISKRGNEDLRRLLIHGARAVLNWCTKKDDVLSQWLQQLKNRTQLQGDSRLGEQIGPCRMGRDV